MVAQKVQAHAGAQTKGKERGDGPMVVTYGNKEGQHDLKRPRNATSVVVVQRHGNVKQVYDLTKLPENVKNDMVAYAFAQRAKTYVLNHTENGADVITLCNGLFADMEKGNLYARSADGEKPGRKFDAVKWADVMKAALLAMNKKGRTNAKTGKVIQPMSEQGYKDFITALEAAAPKERTEKIAGWKKDGFFMRALKEYEFKNAEVDNEATDLF
jgi:hypothetical protein